MRLKMLWYGLDDKPERRHLWRDYWEAMSLALAFRRLGIDIIEDYSEDADIDFMIYGRMRDDLTAPRRFAWINGQGDMACNEDWSQFDHVWIRSRPYAGIFREACPQSSVLLGSPTNIRFASRTEEPIYDITYLGGESAERIDLLNMLIDKGYKIGVGGGLVNYLPKGKFGNEGHFVENNRLGEFFNKGKLFLYTISHYKDTANGFISSTPLDCAATSEALILHEAGPGVKDVFSRILQFDFTVLSDLEEKIDYGLSIYDSEEFRARVRTSRKEAMAVSNDVVAAEMREFFIGEQ